MDDKVSETIAILCALTIGMIIIAIVQRGKFNRVWFVLTLGAYAIYESAYWVARWLPLPFLRSLHGTGQEKPSRCSRYWGWFSLYPK